MNPDTGEKFDVVLDPEDPRGDTAPRRGKLVPTQSGAEWQGPAQFNLVLHELPEFGQFVWMAPPADATRGCLTHLLVSAVQQNVLKRTQGVINAGDLRRSELGTQLPDAETNARFFSLRQKPYWVIHEGSIPGTDLSTHPLDPRSRPITDGRARPQEVIRQSKPGVESAPSKAAQASTSPVKTDAPARRDTESPQGQSPPTQTVLEQPTATQGTALSPSVLMHLELLEEDSDAVSPRPDFQALIPALRQSLCLTLDGKAALPWTQDGERITVSLKAGELERLSAGRRERPLTLSSQDEPSSSTLLQPACLTSPQGATLTPGTFAARVEPSATFRPEVGSVRVTGEAGGGDFPLRIRVRVPRGLHRAQMLDDFNDKVAPSGPDRALRFRWSVQSVETPPSWRPLTEGRDAQLILGFPLKYRLQVEEGDQGRSESSPGIELRAREGESCSVDTTPSSPKQPESESSCTLVSIRSPLKTLSLTLKTELKGDCAQERLPLMVHLHAPGTSSTEVWPKAPALMVALEKPQEIPSRWLPLTASLLPEDERRWMLEPWQLDASGSDPDKRSASLKVKPRLEERGVPVIWSGPAGAQDRVRSLTVTNLCGGSPQRVLRQGSGPQQSLVLPLELPMGLDLKKIQPFLKKLKEKPAMSLEPPRGLRLKGCGLEKATCSVALDKIWDEKGITLTFEKAPRVTLLFVFLSKQLKDPEALYYGLEAHMNLLRERQPKGGTIHLVVTDGRAIASATDDPQALAATLQKVVEWSARGIAPQVLEKLDEATRGLEGLRRDWLELDLKLFVSQPVWEDISREEDWIRRIIREQSLSEARASLFDVNLPRQGPEPLPYGRLLNLAPIP